MHNCNVVVPLQTAIYDSIKPIITIGISKIAIHMQDSRCFKNCTGSNSLQYRIIFFIITTVKFWCKYYIIKYQQFFAYVFRYALYYKRLDKRCLPICLLSDHPRMSFPQLDFHTDYMMRIDWTSH